MNYCSNCGSDKLLFKIPDGDNFKRFICSNCQTVHYNNPQIIVGCLPVYKESIVICRRAIDPCKGTWNLPGGFMENGEKAEEGALRELNEETGLTGRIIKLHCIYSIPHVNQVYLIYLTDIIDLNLQPGAESLEVDVFSEENIPWGEIGFTSSVFAIEKFLEYKSQPVQKTYIGSYHHQGPENRKEYKN